MPQDLQVTGLGGAGNFLSTRERIKEEILRDRPDSDDDIISRGLIDAMRFYSRKRLHFNQGKTQIFTQPGRDEYGPETVFGLRDGVPADLLAFDEVNVSRDPVADKAPPKFLPGTGAEKTVPQPPVARAKGPFETYPMTRISIEEMRWYKSWLTTKSVPYVYSFDGRAFEIHPAPDGVYSILLDYFKDLDVPRYLYAGGFWIYVDRAGNPLDDDYSTPWLDHAEALIRNRCKYSILAGVYKDQEGAQAALEEVRAELSSLESLHWKQVGVGEIQSSRDLAP